MADDDIICLSSDTDDESAVDTKGKVAVNGGVKKKIMPTTLLDMGFKVEPHSQQSSVLKSANGFTEHSNNSARPVVKPEKTPEVFTVDDDDDSYEIEFAKNESNVPKVVAVVVEDSDDDEIQVLQDGGPIRQKKRMRTSQESQGTKEVNLSFPGLNLGLITAGGGKSGSSKVEDDDVASKASVDSGQSLEEVVEEEEEKPVAGPGPLERLGMVSSGNYMQDSKRVLDRFIDEFWARQRRVDQRKIDKLKQKLYDAYDKISHFHRPIHERLIEEIEQAVRLLRATPDHWKTAKSVLDLMQPEIVRSWGETSDEQVKAERERKKLELRRKYEKELAKMQKKIRKLEEAEVNWDDEEEHNSPYILADKYKTKLIQSYYILCDLSDCNRFTGRPTQAKINLRKHNAGSPYECIDSAVEKFINKKGFMFAPDYADVLEIITNVNQSERLELNQDEIDKTAYKLFKNVIEIIKKRREKDFKMSMLALLPRPGTSGSDQPSSVSQPLEDFPEEDEDDLEERYVDPASEDAELKAKLEENDKQRKSEKDVFERFSKIAEDKQLTARAVEDENVNGSPPPSDNEEDDETEEEEDEHTNVSNRSVNEELTEDEDEVRETVGSAWQRGELDDENSNMSNDDKSSSDNKSDTETEGISASGDEGVSNASTECTSKRPLEDSLDGSKHEDELPPAKKTRSDENCNEEPPSAPIIAEEDSTEDNIEKSKPA